MPYVDFSGTKADFRVNYTETADVANGVSYIFIDSVQIKSTVWSGITYYACGKILVGGQVALEMDGTITYTSNYMPSTGVWYTFENTEVRTPITVSNDGRGRTTTIGIGPYGSYNQFNAWCISDSRGNAYASAQSKTINLYKLPTYALSISAGTGSSITVKRNGTTLSNGATLYQGDSLVITFGSSTGYDLATHKVNGNDFTSGGTHTVASAVSVVSTASVKSFLLSISAGTGSIVTINRTSSPLKGASSGQLSDGATVYYNDVLVISFGTSIGYNLNAHTVNGNIFTSGNSHNVTSAVTVVSSATVKQFVLTKTPGTGTVITVTRTYSPLAGASLGALSSGDTIYHSDVISITVEAIAGYVLQSEEMNGGPIQTPYSVSENVTIVAVALAAGAYISNGSIMIMYQISIKGQQIWDLYRPVVFNGNSWENY